MSEFLQNNFSSEITLMHWTNYAQMKYTHTHSQYELYFCADDSKQHAVINGVEYRYKYPCVIISSPYTVHAMSCVDPTMSTYDRYVFNFSESIIPLFDDSLIPKKILSKNTGYMFPLKKEEANSIKNMIDAVSPKTASERTLLLLTVLNRLVMFCPLENAVCVGGPSGYIQTILQYIAEHYAENISADILAHIFLVSRSKLDRDFKKFTGVTLHTFIEICRLNQAKILLTTRRDLSVAEIAEMSGFSGGNYFFPFFKKHTGMTPSEFINH